MSHRGDVTGGGGLVKKVQKSITFYSDGPLFSQNEFFHKIFKISKPRELDKKHVLNKFCVRHPLEKNIQPKFRKMKSSKMGYITLDFVEWNHKLATIYIITIINILQRELPDSFIDR